MLKILKALFKKCFEIVNRYAEKTTMLIEKGLWTQVLWQVLQGVSVFLIAISLILLLCYLISVYFEFVLYFVFIPVFVIYALYSWATMPNEEVTTDFNMVEEELIKQKASDLHDILGELMFDAITSVSSNTALKRPLDISDIQRSSASEGFYLYKNIPIFQFECSADTALEKGEETIILRELQRSINRKIQRYPLLTSIESKGQMPVEVLDVRSLGGFVLIEVVINNSEESRALIEAKRRARIEREQKVNSLYDNDF